jgi:hypothetical protein
MASEIHIQPKNPEAARAEIERTRARMSETIDEIEVALLKKKTDLQERFDLRARLAERPLHVAGAVLGAGLLLGFLTGGGKDRHVAERSDERATLWEGRARRLLAIARDQEEEIDELEAALVDAVSGDEFDDDEWDDVAEGELILAPSPFTELRHEIGDWIGSLAAEAATTLLAAIRRRR